ncbi:hypothetical protein EYF80_000330 [Liparis tanakae]|uniref:Uncharacterized protein n=1 Tax=Liparis tanakae TaxID=230148 RepID=A0A4Z2JIC7_9TELE|nr:hypothetical protein EYF80_000330 [Liparis tanakae]
MAVFTHLSMAKSPFLISFEDAVVQVGVFRAPVPVLCRQRQQGGVRGRVLWDGERVDVLVEQRRVVVGVQNQHVYGGDGRLHGFAFVSGLDHKTDQETWVNTGALSLTSSTSTLTSPVVRWRESDAQTANVYSSAYLYEGVISRSSKTLVARIPRTESTTNASLGLPDTMEYSICPFAPLSASDANTCGGNTQSHRN